MLNPKPKKSPTTAPYEKGVASALRGEKNNPYKKGTTPWKAWWKGWYDTRGVKQPGHAPRKSDDAFWGCTEREWYEKHAGYVPEALR